jgi:hypothetical protein
MKKVFMILGVCLMAALAVVSCNKPANNNKPSDKEQEGEKEGEKEGEGEFSMEVAIDGDFSEWDTLTGDTADGANYVVEENGSTELDGVLRVKATSDKDFLYIYAEVMYDYIFEADGGPFELGNSNDGFHPSHPGSPGPLWVWVDADGDASGAVATADEVEALWDYSGFDSPIQYYFCFDNEAGKMQMGWQQMNWPMDGEDYLNSSSEDWGRAFQSGEGWDPNTDNIASGVNDVAFSGILKIKDPASNKEVEAIKMEIAIGLDALLPNGGKVADNLFIGVSYENPGHEADCQHNYLSEVSGKVPSGSAPFKLVLKK